MLDNPNLRTIGAANRLPAGAFLTAVLSAIALAEAEAAAKKEQRIE